MQLLGIDLSPLALLGLEWTRPLGLLALVLPLALVLLMRRRAPPRPVATGTLSIWEAAGAERRAESRRTRRGLPPRARVLCAALVLGALAIAGPRAERSPASGRWRVVVDRSPSMYLPLELGGERTRYDAALAAGLEQLDGGEEVSPEREWITPGEEARLGEEPPAAWSEPPRWAREEPRWERWDEPGVLWLTDRAPEVPEGGAALVASGGVAVPGRVDSRGGRELLWDGDRLVEGDRVPPGRVGVGGELPAELRELLGIWTDERGLELSASASSGDRECRLFLHGTPGEGLLPIRAGRDGWGLEGRAAEAGAPLEDERGALEPWLTTPDGALCLVSRGPGRVRVAVAEIGQLAGDPASLAVSWSMLFDRALLPPEGAVPVAERLSAGEPCLVSGGSPVRPPAGGDPAEVPIEAWLGLGSLALAALALFSQRVSSSPPGRRG